MEPEEKKLVFEECACGTWWCEHKPYCENCFKDDGNWRDCSR